MNWQPIETAPRDGQPVLLYLSDSEAFYVGYYMGDGFWNTGTPAMYESDFSHWCELTPPK